MGFAVTVDGSTSGVSGANVVAGEGGSDDANSGNTIGKSEMLNCGTTGPLGTEYFSTGGGTFVTVTRGLFRSPNNQGRSVPENQFSVELFEACASKRTWAMSGGRGVCFSGAPTGMDCLLLVLWRNDPQVRLSMDES